ncbi:hypothetical protein [Polynucleobacter sinensis]|uniref:hypothetical protein n=1 Tax=Polynucleobacter sinensis TaxID=1743157 RepID=UPI000782C575|nr:hypothetical protein [Polynucleobacter sinensis]
MTSIELSFSKKYALGKLYSVRFILVMGHEHNDEDSTLVEFFPQDISPKLREFLLRCDLFEKFHRDFDESRLKFVKAYYAERCKALYQ